MERQYLPVINTQFTLFGGHIETVPIHWIWPPEEHPAFELIYIIKGRQRTVTEIGDLVINEGEFTVIPVETRHTNYAMDDQPMTFFCMHFDLDSPELKYLLIREYADRTIQQTDAIYRSLRAQVEELMALLKSDYSLFDQLIIQSVVLKIIRVLINSLEVQQQKLPRQRNINQFFLCQKIANEIKSQLDYEIYHSETPARISIAEIIERHHISQSYALKLFKQYLRQSPQQYAISLKLTISKRLLVQPEMQINEISEKLAYSAPSHFSREFKKYFNITPREYIRQFNSNSVSAN